MKEKHMRIRTFTSLFTLLLFSVISVPATRPQTNAKVGMSREAFVTEKEAVAREKAKQERAENEPPRDGEEWFARGYRMHGSDRYPEAIEAFKHAIDLGYRQATAMYNIACGYSLLNEKENALAWLQKSLDNGFDTWRLAQDSDLDPLRSDARFKKIMDGLPKAGESSDRDWKNKRYAKSDRLEQANLDYARLSGESSQDGQQWAKVGMNLLLLRELDHSITSLLKAVSYLEDDASGPMYNLACAYSLKGDRDSGIQWLERAVNGGFDSPQKLSYDPDLRTLRADSRFSAIEKLSNTLTLSQFNEKRDYSNDSQAFNYSKERWAPAIALYESFVKSEPGNGRAWFNLGYALHYSREHARAVDAFQHAVTLNYHKPVASYNVACAYSMLNQKDKAFAWLDRSFTDGFSSKGNLKGDRDLDNLRSDPRFQRFLELAVNNKKVKKD
jgi:Flp pilus assembly protein TadD